MNIHFKSIQMKKRFYKTFIIISIITNNIYSQPNMDNNLNLLFEDNFDSFDASKWVKVSDPRGNELQWYENANKNIEYTYNSTASSNVLKIKAYKENPSLNRNSKLWNYSSEQLYSIKNDFRYGYYEVRCKMPLFLRSFPAFWLLTPNNGLPAYEIDALEYLNEKLDSYSTNYFDWWQLDPPGNTNDDKYNRPMWISASNIRTGFHTYGIDWSPDHLYFYYDNILVRFVKDSHISDQEMFLILNLAIRGYNISNPDVGNPSCSTGCDPFEVDYVRTYEHDCSANGTSITQSNFFASPTYGVHKSYTISNSTVPSGAHVVLRATDFVTLQNNFIVPAGSEFYVVMTQCP